MRFLLLAMPYQGHVGPTFNLARELISRGHVVDYVTSENFADEVRQTGAGLFPFSDNQADLAQMTIDSYNTAIAQKGEYDALIYDEFNFTGRVLAKELGIPGIRFYPSTVANENILKQLLVGPGFLGILSDPATRDYFTKTVNDGIGNHEIEDCVSEPLRNAPDLTIVFVPDWFQPEVETFPKDQFKFVGPSIRGTSQTLPEWFQRDPQKPLVYLALGTIENDQPDLYRKFLEAFGDIDANFILSVGNRVNQDDLGEIPANCQVKTSVPQNAILGVTDLFITHGGMNSVNEALVNGVPMFVVPLSNDQPIDAQQVSRLGNGVTAEPESLTPEIIGKLVREALSSQEMKARAKELQSRLAGKSGAVAGADEILKFMESRA